MAEMKKPEKGGTPKKITTEAPAGGSQTPGAKGTYPKGGKIIKRSENRTGKLSK